MSDLPVSCGTENWVFIGDSLTEGVGSARLSYVSALVDLLRAQVRGTVHGVRLRYENSRSISRYVAYNVVGKIDHGESSERRALWLWNLASEGTTAADDSRWVALIYALRPRVVVISRGALETVLRPSPVKNGDWPWWVPRGWRGYAAMDPRCYFSTGFARRTKQQLVDAVKQGVRLRLLERMPGESLESAEATVANIANVLAAVTQAANYVVVCGLLPISESTFPRSSECFTRVNERLRTLCVDRNLAFLDWQAGLDRSRLTDYFMRDGFHPNACGARRLAELLRDRLEELGVIEK